MQIQSLRSQNVKPRLRVYYEYTKPKIWYLLVLTSLTSTFVATRLLNTNLSLQAWLIAAVAIISGTAGCNALTNYHDRDIDAVMMRTRNRPLPTRRIEPKSALQFGLSLVIISLVLASVLNLLSMLWMGLGIIDNVVVYSLVLKRRSSSNILLGGFSGGLPVMFGWSAATAGPIGSLPLAPIPLLMAGLVFVWIPVHIWFLAVAYRNDYSQAGIPMLPVVIGSIRAIRVITLFSMVMIPFSLGLFLLGYFGPIYAGVAIVTGIANLIGSLWVLYRPSQTNAWRMFKVSSPYLTILFVAMIIDVALRH